MVRFFCCCCCLFSPPLCFTSLFFPKFSLVNMYYFGRKKTTKNNSFLVVFRAAYSKLGSLVLAPDPHVCWMQEVSPYQLWLFGPYLGEALEQVMGQRRHMLEFGLGSSLLVPKHGFWDSTLFAFQRLLFSASLKTTFRIDPWTAGRGRIAAPAFFASHFREQEHLVSIIMTS